MSSFQVEGGHRLKGNIAPQGAKNEALQILCAVLLTEETVTISNIPDIVDVNKLIALLKKMGVKVTFLEKGKYVFTADDIDLNFLNTQ
jgi:UDP-N-acetylglucosamine 1-carboxyvinyltransferase